MDAKTPLVVAFLDPSKDAKTAGWKQAKRTEMAGSRGPPGLSFGMERDSAGGRTFLLVIKQNLGGLAGGELLKCGMSFRDRVAMRDEVKDP